MANPAFRSISNTTYASRTNTTITAPAGIQDGDRLSIFLFMGHASGTPATPTFPSNFAMSPGFPVSMADATSFQGRLYHATKIAAGESGNYTITHSTDTTEGVMHCASDGSGDLKIGVPNCPLDVNGATTTAFSIDAWPNALVVFLDQTWGGDGALTAPTGSTPTLTERLDTITGADLIYVADGVFTVGGATGNRAHGNGNSAGNTQPWTGYLFAIAPVVSTVRVTDYSTFPKRALRR